MKKRRFKHLSWTDRLKIETMLKDKRHKQEIADEIGVHLKTIYNEIKRGRYIHTNSDLTKKKDTVRKWPKRLTANTWPQKVRT